MERMQYSEIYDYWSNNLCDGGNADFTFGLFKNKRVLEIGCGAGNDAQRFIEAEANYTGIDLTNKAVEYTRNKIGLKDKVLKMNAEYLDFSDEYFDLVYSWGVIHHIITPQNAIDEIYRVLKKEGFIYIMLYNKFSFRYLVEICILRKILWWCRYYKFSEIRKIIPHPTKEQWISINTDNIGCPLSRVYTKKEAMDLFSHFRFIITFIRNKGWFRIIWGQK